MTRKEVMDQILSRVPAELREAFIAEIREAETKEARKAVLKKYGIELTAEEREAIRANANNEINDEELDKASGGCCFGPGAGTPPGCTGCGSCN